MVLLMRLDRTGWDKNLPSDQRKRMALRASGGDGVAAGRVLLKLARGTRKGDIRRLARADAYQLFKEG
jgi:hypothetical protein